VSNLNGLKNLLDNKISVGKIVNSHGVKGEVKILPFTNLKSLIRELDHVILFNPSNKSFFFSKVLKVKDLNRFYVLALQGVTNIDEAKKMMGYEIYTDIENLPCLEEDEYYWFEILESKVYYEDGEYIGQVQEIIETGANEVISVVKEEPNGESKETLIPMTDYYIVELKKDEKTIITKKMDWYNEGKEDAD
jgi:16S rRNA processing protein RimM